MGDFCDPVGAVAVGAEEVVDLLAKGDVSVDCHAFGDHVRILRFCAICKR